MDKAEIVEIGTFDLETGEPKDWVFDCKGYIPGFEITQQGILYAGYTLNELRQAALDAKE